MLKDSNVDLATRKDSALDVIFLVLLGNSPGQPPMDDFVETSLDSEVPRLKILRTSNSSVVVLLALFPQRVGLVWSS